MAPESSTMRAWQYKTRNKPFESNLSLNTVPIPKVPSGSDKKQCILIKVHAVSINPADYKLPETPVIGLFMNSKPATPGLDYAGVVVEIPKGLKTDLQPGNRVAGRFDWPFQHGALAEYILGQPNGVVKLPEGVSFAQGAAIGTAGLTSLQPIEAFVKPGDSVLISGGSGGVGSFSTQVAKLLGAGHVTVICSAANAERVKALGADEVIDYRTKNVLSELKTAAKDNGKLYDHVVDNVGNSDGLFENCHHFVKPGGHFYQIASANMGMVLKRSLLPGFLGGGKRNYNRYLTFNSTKQMEKLLDWIKEGKLQVQIDEEFSFEKAPEAFAKLRTERAKGKVVINVAA